MLQIVAWPRGTLSLLHLCYRSAMRSAGTSERQLTRWQRVALIVGGATLVTTPPTVLLGWAVSEYLWELWWLNAGSSGLLDGVPDRPVVVRALVGLALLLVVVLCVLGVVTRTRARGELTATALFGGRELRVSQKEPQRLASPT